MFSHIMIGTNDIEELYFKLFEVLGARPGKMISRTGLKRYFYNFKDTSFAISEPLDGKEATVANGATIGFNLERKSFKTVELPLKVLVFVNMMTIEFGTQGS